MLINVCVIYSYMTNQYQKKVVFLLASSTSTNDGCSEVKCFLLVADVCTMLSPLNGSANMVTMMSMLLAHCCIYDSVRSIGSLE